MDSHFKAEPDQQTPPDGALDHQQPDQFATLLNHLFATRLAPGGRPYTLTEVARGTGMSLPYLSILRKGMIAKVPFQRVATLAKFFHVPLDYFDQEGAPVDMVDTLVQDALAKPLVRDVVLRAGRLGTTQLALVLQMLEHAEQVLQELKTPPASQPTKAPDPSKDEEATL